MLKLAAKIAIPTPSSLENDLRDYWLGCVGYRKDGVLVSSKNGSYNSYHKDVIHLGDARHHAEGRTIRKLGKDAPELFVSRVRKLDGKLAMAAPCELCQNLIKAHRVAKVYFTISESEYGLWIPAKDEWKTYKDRK